MYGYETTARWIAIDTPAGVAAADAELRRRPLAFLLSSPASSFPACRGQFRPARTARPAVIGVQ
jgi:hypothetical protein